MKQIRRNWKCCHCGKIYKSRRLLSIHRKEEHPQYCVAGGWNKGLTKETSDILAKRSDTFKERIKSGEIIPPWKDKHLTFLTK